MNNQINIIISSLKNNLQSLRRWGRAFIHNAIVHPVMMFLPREVGVKIHDKNADWAFEDI